MVLVEARRGCAHTHTCIAWPRDITASLDTLILCRPASQGINKPIMAAAHVRGIEEFLQRGDDTVAGPELDIFSGNAISPREVAGAALFCP